jgi:hypothetical protein
MDVCHWQILLVDKIESDARLDAQGVKALVLSSGWL